MATWQVEAPREGPQERTSLGWKVVYSNPQTSGDVMGGSGGKNLYLDGKKWSYEVWAGGQGHF